MSDYLNAVNKYVVSSTLDDPGWENSTVLRGAVIGEVLKLKEERAATSTGCSCSLWSSAVARDSSSPPT